MLLKELTEQPGLDSEKAILAAYPEPALLIEPFGDAKSDTVDTPSAPFGTGTEVLSPAHIQQELAKSPDFFHPETRVEWLKKTSRNPFANLITLGRARNNDIVVPHSAISKVHVTFSAITNQWFVQDGNSRNGTFLNGVRLDTGEKKPVQDGDAVGLGGEVSARFFMPSSLWLFISQLQKGGDGGA